MKNDHITDTDSLLNWIEHNINIFKKATKCLKNGIVTNVEKVKFEPFDRSFTLKVLNIN